MTASTEGTSGTCRVTSDRRLIDLLGAGGLTTPATVDPLGNVPALPLSWLGLSAGPCANRAVEMVAARVTDRADGPLVVVLASHRVRLERPLVAGEHLRVEACLGTARQTPRGLVGRVRTVFSPHATTDPRVPERPGGPGGPVVLAEVVSRFVIAGGSQALRTAGPPESRSTSPEPETQVLDDVVRTWAPRAEFGEAFAEVSGDRQGIHLNDQAAAVAGFAGPVLHGAALFAAAESTAFGSGAYAGSRELGVSLLAPVIAGSGRLRIGRGSWCDGQEGRQGSPVRSAALRIENVRGCLVASGRAAYAPCETI